MNKIKIFDCFGLEKEVNEFIKDKKVIIIQYIDFGLLGGGKKVMVWYEEELQNEQEKGR